MEVLFFIKLAVQGEYITSKLGVLGIPFTENTPWDMDNIGKKWRVPFVYAHWFFLNWLPQSKMLRPLDIKVFSLCIQTDSLLSLSEFDLGTSFGNLVYSSICMVMSLAIKMSCHCSVIILFDVKYITLESIYHSVFCLSYIFNMAPVAFQAIYQVITLASTFSDCVVGFIIV